MDLKAGLKDSDYDLVLDSIRILGNMHHLQSEAELISLLDSQDMLVRTYVYQALLRLQDYSSIASRGRLAPGATGASRRCTDAHTVPGPHAILVSK